MTLFSAPHATKVLALSVAIAAGGMMAAAQANDGAFDAGVFEGDSITLTTPRHERRERRDWRERDRYRHDDRRAERRREHRQSRSGNFYGGAITAYRDRGNGIYFYIERDRYSDVVDAPFLESGGPKVIHVIPGQDDCSWEAGVCVIRPSR
jgi:hypothetical protein